MIVSIIIILIITFGFVVFFGAPYLPSLKNSKVVALDLLDLKPGQVLIDLGSGDGRVLRAAAEKGLKVVGYEINPLLVLISKLTTWPYRRQVKIVWGNFWSVDWPRHDGIYVFLIDKYMSKLDQKIKQQSRKGVKVASNTFKIPGKKIIAEKQGVFLYVY